MPSIFFPFGRGYAWGRGETPLDGGGAMGGDVKKNAIIRPKIKEKQIFSDFRRIFLPECADFCNNNLLD